MRRKKGKDHDLLFDEFVSDTVSGEAYTYKEQPIHDRVFQGVFAISVLLGVIVVGMVVYLSGFKFSYYAARAESNSSKETSIPAPRGIIVDRFGTALVENRPIFSVVLDVREMIKTDQSTEVLSLLSNTLGLDTNEVKASIKKLNLEENASLIVARDITREQVLALKDASLTAVRVEDDYKRYYPLKEFAHVLGYVGESSDARGIHGQSGLEASYDELLSGVDGRNILYRDALGEEQALAVVEKPIIGDELKTTLDAEFQKYFHDRFAQGLADLGRVSGVGLAIDPRNGEILALMNFPDYDPNNIADYLTEPHEPLFNRAVSGSYNPASTIKLLHASAALHEGVITPEKQIYSAGYIELPNPYHPENPSRFVDWKPQGWVDVHAALARSSNVYFYEVIGGFQDQKGVGIEKLRTYWQKFGLGTRTGIDIPGEAEGFLPSPEEKETRTGLPWRVGDTYNISIGQGDFLVTPVQLVSAVSAIVHGGKAYVPHIGTGKGSQVLLDLTDLSSEFTEVRQGMRDAVTESYGTAHTLNDISCTALGKTGSAQVANKTKTNALFIGAMPAEDPQILILVLIEDAREGSANTLPTAKDVLQWYCMHRIKNTDSVNDSATE